MSMSNEKDQSQSLKLIEVNIKFNGTVLMIHIIGIYKTTIIIIMIYPKRVKK